MLRLMCDGLTNEQIAPRLNLSPEGVRTSIKRMFEKLENGPGGRIEDRLWRPPAHVSPYGRF